MQLDLFSQHRIGKGKCMQSGLIKLRMGKNSIIPVIKVKLRGLSVVHTHFTTLPNRLQSLTVLH